MHRLATGVGATLLVLGAVAGEAQQLANPSGAGRGTLAGAPQPRISRPNQQLLRGTRANILTSIQGNALSPTNGVLPNAVVRLRDARYGHIVDTQVTDHAGLFAFRAIDPGTYVIELMGVDQSVLAASQMLSVGAGEMVSALVKLPWRLPPAGGLLGRTATSAALVSSAAAASGVLATAVVRPAVSGEQ